MNIKWYGHSAFRITMENNLRVILDPYESGAFRGALSYGKITDEADVVVSSHDHADHNYTNDIQGQFILINSPGIYIVKGVSIKAIPTYHDNFKGNERGTNLIHLISAERLVLAHLGDLGHDVDDILLSHIGKIDVLFVPVGGYFTIDATTATNVMKRLKPLLVFPMHYKTELCDFPIAPLSDFLKGKESITRRINGSEINIDKNSLPSSAEVVVLEHAL